VCTALFVQMGNLSVQMETHVVNSLLENGAAVHFHKQSVAVMEFTAVLMATLAMFQLEAVVKEADVYLWYQSCQRRRERLTWTVLFVQINHLSVQMETHVVNFPQDSGVVVHFQTLSVVVMENIAVLMDTRAMSQLEPAVKEA